jgi:toxin ParE1/3/4
MSQKIVRRDFALSDLNDIADYIQKDSPESAIRFFIAAEKTFAMLAESPEMGTVCQFRSPRFSNFRLWTIKGFRHYIIVYRPLEQGVEIVRILHGSRDIAAVLNDM